MQYTDSLLKVFYIDEYKTIYFKGGQGICVPEPEQVLLCIQMQQDCIKQHIILFVITDTESEIEQKQ